MHATIHGCDMVWPSPILTAPSRYARLRWSRGRKSSRGTAAMAASTRSSWIPRRRSWRATMRSRSVDVVPEPSGVMHGDLSTTQGDDTRAFKRRKEAAGALARGAGEMGDLGLGRPDQDVLLGSAVGLARDRLREQRARHAAGHGLERLLKQPLVGAAHALREAGQQLQRDVRV